MIGNSIKNARKAKNMTQTELAEKISSSSGTLSHIEIGSRNPSLEMLQKIADALAISLTDLLDGDNDVIDGYVAETHNKLENRIAEKGSEYTAFPLKDLQVVTSRLIKMPVLGKISARAPILSKENIIDYILIPESEVANGSYFYLQVVGDSMINSGIKNGYRVLVRCQPEVETGEIAIVRVENHDATLKRVKKINDQIILYSDNSAYEPIVIIDENAQIIGKVVRVEFDPNKKY